MSRRELFLSRWWSRVSAPGQLLSKQRGMGLIEVLVALLLLSVALLGLGILQINTMQHQRSSYNNTMAQLLALNMAERVHANLDGLASYAGQSTNAAPTSGCMDNCSPQELAAQDLIDWEQAINDSSLTAGVGSIYIDDSNDSSDVEISLIWQDPLAEIENKDGGNTFEQNFSFSVML